MNDIYNPNINSINIPIQDMEKIKGVTKRLPKLQSERM